MAPIPNPQGARGRRYGNFNAIQHAQGLLTSGAVTLYHPTPRAPGTPGRVRPGDPTALSPPTAALRAALASAVSPGHVRTLRRQHLPDGPAREPDKDMRTLLKTEVATGLHANAERDTDPLTRGRGEALRKDEAGEQVRPGRTSHKHKDDWELRHY